MGGTLYILMIIEEKHCDMRYPSKDEHYTNRYMTIHTYMYQIQYLYILESINAPRYVHRMCVGICVRICVCVMCRCVYVAWCAK